MWLRIRSLIVKELLAIWGDPKSRFLLLGPPVIELLIFAYAATQEVKNVRIAILNQDMGIYARDLVARFEGSPNFRSVRHLAADAEVTQAIDSRSVLLVVRNPPGLFTTDRRSPARRSAAHPGRPQLEHLADPHRLCAGNHRRV